MRSSATIAAAVVLATAQATHELNLYVDNSAAEGISTFKDLGASVEWSVEMTIFDVLSSTYDDCREGDYINMNWHIHVGKPDGGQGVGAECAGDAGSSPVGGHYDPTFACGPATDNVEECDVLDRSVANDDFKYPCDPEEYEKNPYACEVGDYSGKYGALKFKINHHKKTAYVMAKDIDEYGPQLKLIQNRAITFHCGSPRIFCGTLITGTAPKKDEKEEENEKEIYDRP